MIHNIFFEHINLKSYTIKANESGQRLDYALKMLFPSLGLRARRRLWQYCEIFVNNKKCLPSYKVQINDNISLMPIDKHEQAPQKTSYICSIKRIPYKKILLTKIDHNSKLKCLHLIKQLRISYFFMLDEPMLIQEKENYIFLYKPRGLHSVSLSGSNNHSLESQLTQFLPNSNSCTLINRLDKETSGIVIATQKADILDAWHKLENQGLCTKYYLALVNGSLNKALIIKNNLDTNNRQKTLVQHTISPSILRHTAIEPLAYLNFGTEQKLTLVGCTIKKGARHQIRAHLAYSGYALWGDALYGKNEQYSFVLHHCGLRLQQEKVIYLPNWFNAQKLHIQKKIIDWINNI